MYRENESGRTVIEPLPRLREFRGAATTSERGTAIVVKERAIDEIGSDDEILSKLPRVRSNGYLEAATPA